MKSAIKGNWYLFDKLVKKDIKARYEGSVLGVLWSFIVPLVMLAIYTFVFSEVFKAKWDVDTTNKFEFAMTLFCGLIVYNMFADIVTRSTTLIASNQNYVKKVVFPIEILPVVVTFSILFNCIISYLILIVTNTVLIGVFPYKLIQAVFILVPHILFCTGISYLISAVSVYLKDLSNVVNIIVMAGMYVSPIFFPLNAVPKKFQFAIMLNPITYVIENMRRVILYNKNLDLQCFFISILVSTIVFLFGKWVFMRAKEGFADLL